ncbi:MAG: leucyl aminopeptidase [Rhizobiales bacterium]|nr:leucyl aminopeptidase [Hyphomicrobiales bacterium]
MRDQAKIEFGALAAPKHGTLVVLVGDDLAPSTAVAGILADMRPSIAAAAKAARFKGKANATFEILAPEDVSADRVIVVGLGSAKDRADADWTKAGGAVAGKLGKTAATVLFDLPGETADAASAAADFALGARLRAYAFDKYKTKTKSEEDGEDILRLTVGVADPAAARKAAKAREAAGEGVIIARNLVNEPPNVLTPVEFARRAQQLEKLGVVVEVMERKQLEKLGMRALLGVAQGSLNEPRVVIMRWNGAKKGKQPVAFVGKGVTFDTGGISIKPGAGMEDMKGDMAGAACVVGLMHALAARKAKVNVVAAIGLVENMPDGGAQRPGDIVESMSGQTIEIINTDAEGRLVLADVLWHVQTKYKPAFMVDLATLTGAILVALAQVHAGLFSNDDELAARLDAAGKATGETVWRMPLGPAFDKMIDSRFADMKNSAGRNGGSSTAAQFLQRFVRGTPWAHLDIAGTGMGSPQSEINQSWGSGWGVRLLDRLVADHYEG